jgi:hypothetical protein
MNWAIQILELAFVRDRYLDLYAWETQDINYLIYFLLKGTKVDIWC